MNYRDRYIPQSNCNKKGIFIYPIPVGTSQYVLTIDNNGLVITGKKLLKKKPKPKELKWWEEIERIYNQLNNKI